MQSKLYVNGRFLGQPLSGVQRFATEMTSALARVCPGASALRPVLLVPPAARSAEKPITSLTIGQRNGQAWEQFELPRHARDGVLINLGNTAPIATKTQIVVIHDAGVFSSPAAYSWKFRLWYKMLQKALILRGAMVVTVSEFSRQELSKYMNVPASSIRVVSEGADHMHRLSEDDGVLRQHGLIAGRFVLAVGNLSAHKNLRALSRTAQMLGERGMTLVVTGGLDHGVFRSGADLPNPATYVGRVSDRELKALYGAAACFVFPSLYEGFGLPAIEAMACNCAVVGSDIPALREACGSAALYADPASPEAIAAQVMRIVENDNLRAEMRERACQHVQRFTWNAAASGLVAVAEDLLRRAPSLQPGRAAVANHVSAAPTAMTASMVLQDRRHLPWK